MNIVFLDRQTLTDDVNLRRPRFPHTWQDYASTNPEQRLAHAQHADILIVNKVKLDAAILKQLPRLKLIAVAATGTNNVDLAAAAQQQIIVSNIQDYAAQSIAEHSIGLMFNLRRNITAYHQAVQQGRWQQSQQFCFFDYPIDNLAGQKLVIIGAGNLGQATAKLAKSIGMEVIFAERKNQAPRTGRVDFTDALACADVLSIHCPLSSETADLITHTELALMKPSALLINTARGGIVNEAALLEALRSGGIAGAACDVVSQEPPSSDNPLLQAQALSNFILTPHVGWASSQSMQSLADQLIDNIEAFSAGQPRNQV
ncbi:D-2-hydroxyacid dehydrogenase [Agarivorans sp. QJM3NY_33]|uniref:D-2-hydroxyacid dehydrogenase n=1 Tax=Agarivorans sp. QJM3NY_33 TaxID=3421432 RepID=UPI003D7CA71A